MRHKRDGTPRPERADFDAMVWSRALMAAAWLERQAGEAADLADAAALRTIVAASKSRHP